MIWSPPPAAAAAAKAAAVLAMELGEEERETPCEMDGVKDPFPGLIEPPPVLFGSESLDVICPENFSEVVVITYGDELGIFILLSWSALLGDKRSMDSSSIAFSSNPFRETKYEKEREKKETR